MSLRPHSVAGHLFYLNKFRISASYRIHIRTYLQAGSSTFRRSVALLYIARRGLTFVAAAWDCLQVGSSTLNRKLNTWPIRGIVNKWERERLLQSLYIARRE